MTYRGTEGVQTLMQAEQDNEIFRAIRNAFNELEHLRNFRDELQRENNRLLAENRAFRCDRPDQELSAVEEAVVATRGNFMIPQAEQTAGGLDITFGGVRLKLYRGGVFEVLQEEGE